MDGMTSSPSDTMTAEEYSETVYQWSLQVHRWQSFVKGFPAYLAYQSALFGNQQQNSRRQICGDGQSSGTTRTGERSSSSLNWREFKIPTLWKRFTAESIDCVILVFAKLLLTYVTVDCLHIFQLERLYQPQVDSGMITTIEMTTDFIILEMLFKLMVVIFEALWTFSGLRGRSGGATPGKLLMGISIVSCDHVVLIGNRVVQVAPAEGLGGLRAVVRSVLKNVVTTFFFPFWAGLFLSLHRRAAHDVVAKTIVIEEPGRAVR